MSDEQYNPDHYHTDGRLQLETVDVIEEFFLHDAHLSQAFKYMARAGKKTSSSYIVDVGKAGWWLTRAAWFHGGNKAVVGIKDLLRQKGVIDNERS